MTDRAAASLPIPGTARSWWLREALAAEATRRCCPRCATTSPPTSRSSAAGTPASGRRWFLRARATPSTSCCWSRTSAAAGRAAGTVVPQRAGGRSADARPSLRDEAAVAIRACRGRGRSTASARGVRPGVDAWYANRRLPPRVNAFPGRPTPGWRTPGGARRLGLGDALPCRSPQPRSSARLRLAPAFGDGLLVPSAAIGPAGAPRPRALRRVLARARRPRSRRARARCGSTVRRSAWSTAGRQRRRQARRARRINAWAARLAGIPRPVSSPGGRTSC